MIDAGENLWRSLSTQPRNRRASLVTIARIVLAAALGVAARTLLAIHNPL